MPQALINLATLSQNITTLRSYLQSTTQMLVAIKANAYGHGAARVGQRLESFGVNWFGVATASEALELRKSVSANILIFSPVYKNITELVDYNIALTVADEHSFEAIKQADLAKPARVHLKVDTGMGRLGLPGKEAAALARKIVTTKNVTLEGAWTHFAASDDEDKTFTLEQLEQFKGFLEMLKHDDIEPRLIHSANSAATLAFPEAHFDMVRPGIAVYGYHSSPATQKLEPRLTPVMTLTAPITFIKTVGSGTSISYSRMWTASAATKVATVRIGYADGYSRLLSNKGESNRGESNKSEVWLQGQRRPVLGRVCMDQLMIDVTGLDVSIGERVTLFGPEGIDAETLGNRYGTISYDVLTGIAPRVERVYV
ncbi:MAG: alanine racemase [Trueperaceae bacterium]